mmetsp:Transcript_18717/g.17835  ORF Transcript_18717/g.17835 Transcript_18717/m.17835 type:complete len:117 (+) Transcript_18717:1495-1845(+)
MKGKDASIQTEIDQRSPQLYQAKPEPIPKFSVFTQTEECYFPTDPALRKLLMEFVGNKLNKSGDNYDRGSAFFTKANQMIDELESKYLIDFDPVKAKKANGIMDPKYKSFQPVRHK